MILTVILGPLMERALRQSLEMSRGDFTIFFTRPISAALLGLAAVFVATSLMKMTSQVKEDRGRRLLARYESQREIPMLDKITTAMSDGMIAALKAVKYTAAA